MISRRIAFCVVGRNDTITAEQASFASTAADHVVVITGGAVSPKISDIFFYMNDMQLRTAVAPPDDPGAVARGYLRYLLNTGRVRLLAGGGS